MDSQEEVTLWEGRPSYLRDLGLYVVCGLTFWLVVPLFVAAWRWLSTKYHRYEVTSERVRVRTGVLSRHLEELELYRVKDTTLAQSFIERIFGLSNIMIHTSDRTAPVVVLEAIENAEPLREQLRTCVERQRQRKRVREFDTA